MAKIKLLVVSPAVLCLFLIACGTGGSKTFQPPAAVTLRTITVTPASAAVPAGETRQLTATGAYSDGTTKDLTATATWHTSSTSIATVSAAGVLTGVAQGSATVTATSGDVVGTVNVTVSAPVLSSIAISPATLAQIPTGGHQQFTATATWSNGSRTDVTATVAWSSSDAAVASVSSSGLLTAIKQGTAIVTAQSGSIAANVTVTIGPVALASISVVPSSASLAVGETTQLVANGIYSDGSMQDLTAQVLWSSSSDAIATVNSSGLAKAVATGEATVTAAYNSLSASATLTITREQLSSVSIGPDLPSIAAGGVQQFVLTGTFTNGDTQDLTGVTWTSSDPTVAAIGEDGLARGLTPGEVTITGTVGTLSDATTLVVTAATLQSLAITPNTAAIAKGTSQQFTATGTFTDGSTQDLTAIVNWSSSQPGVAAIDAAGLASAMDTGTTVITANAGTVSATASLDVTAAVLTSVLVTPAAPSSGIGGTVQFNATGAYSDGATQDLTTTATWTSSSAVIATINAGGLATAVSAGPATITATFDGVSGSTTLTVTAATLQSITVLPAGAIIAPRAKIQFTALGSFSDGTQRTVPGVSWSSTKPSVASVNNSGLARSKKSGVATVTATLSGVRGSTALTVTSAALTAITITPANPVVAAGTTQQFTATGTFDDGTSADLSAAVRWQTSNYLVATINSAGLAIGVAPGNVTVTATFSGLMATGSLTVSNAVLQSLAIAPMNPSIALGGTQQFTATGSFGDGSTQDLTRLVRWSSSQSTVAVISSTGLATSAGRGSSTIGASFKGVSNSTSLQVN